MRGASVDCCRQKSGGSAGVDVSGAIGDTKPCGELCPACKSRCFGRSGHTAIRTAGKGFAQLHQCRLHVWGSIGDAVEVSRAEARETRREVIESIGGCGRCVAVVKRLGGG